MAVGLVQALVDLVVVVIQETQEAQELLDKVMLVVMVLLASHLHTQQAVVVAQALQDKQQLVHNLVQVA